MALNIDTASVDHVLNTTRSVRKRLDFQRPVEAEVIEECLEIAIQAPTGSNQQDWHFMVITDEEKRRGVSDLYRKGFYGYISPQTNLAPDFPEDDPRTEQAPRVRDSAIYLADNMHRTPVLIIPCIEGRVTEGTPSAQAGFYGSILPAAWSLMLALRARGLGSAWTTLHLPYEKEAAKLLGIPKDITQAALLPVAYFIGEDFKPAKRIPARNVTYWNSWGELS
ncbi:MAG: nitroreductase family protein [Dehalococcoidia bacterium]